MTAQYKIDFYKSLPGKELAAYFELDCEKAYRICPSIPARSSWRIRSEELALPFSMSLLNLHEMMQTLERSDRPQEPT